MGEPRKGTVALVTGASRGGGKGIALVLGEEGAVVYVTGRSVRGEPTTLGRPGTIDDTAEELTARGGTGIAVRCDHTDDSQVEALFERIRNGHGRLDLLVNNAGAAWHATFAEGGWDGVRRHMELNFDAVGRLTEALLPLLRRSAPSAIVNVSSIAGRAARPGSGAYSASKFALAGWTDALAAEERAAGVHVGLVLPGFVATEGFPQRKLLGRVATRWLVSTPEKVAEAIVDAGPGGRAERYVPRPYWLIAAARTLAPALLRRISGPRRGTA
jgi:NAD(P)-dependent dehydrogenase (short-subunit alcohol dehydrogenase family)